MATETITVQAVINANINYFLEVSEGGTDVIYPGTATDKLRPLKSVIMPITDLRTCKDENFTLDTHGFQFVPHKTKEKTYDDQERIKTVVYDETAALLREVTGATRVVPFSHLIRKHLVDTAVEAAKKAAPTDIIPIMTPSLLCHIDQSYDGAKQVLEDNLPPAVAESLSKTRWGIINVWRPVGGPVKRDPLAVCDARSCAESDLRKVFAQLPSQGDGSTVSVGAGFEVFNVAHNPNHKWYYALTMTPDETLMIKCFDSKTDGRARRTPHTAFQTDRDEGPARQSIEVRCLVFWENDSAE
ncbi:conserved hypothetical protein [Talaromyces stipitatus ATCC 10500]|uniref:Methyltransferase n=1 Tax=Talaromyces stipitatus (strain ATCC 10500 / CBS 375.48 / QM 6759 / NRRL 1006) TaxID=441959 RepID=B8MEK6_TALSN|nr:uncharacterized protein TSTA_017080 [Talaromyces stipitatus ATCC 10500]EED16633.1 conserved hypothetical protein [Talaromyces stipitatus ATCC 10500]